MDKKTYPELPSKPETALRLPRMTSKDLQQNQWNDVTEEWSNAKNSITFYRTENGEYKCLFTDLGEEEFLMLSISIHRHIEMFNMWKLVLLDAEKMREIPCKGHDFTYKALEYIKLKKLTNLNLDLK